MAQLEVTVLCGSGLKNMDLFSPQDPYCRIRLGFQGEGEEGRGDTTLETGVVESGGSDPVWPPGAGTVVLPWSSGMDQLSIVVMDRDVGKLDDFVGECCLNVPALARESPFEGEVDLYRNGTVKHGALTLRVSCAGGVCLGGLPCQLVQATAAKLHRNRLLGSVHAFQEHAGGELQFRTFSVALQGIGEIFGDAWNAGRDGIHSGTFQDDAKGEMYRLARQAAHKAFYYDGSFLRGRTSPTFLSTGAGFLGFIKNGVHDGRRRVFTYTVTDLRWHFSETGLKMPKDAVGCSLSADKCSKHAVHADAAAEVRYAGTFRVCQRPTGEPVLVIDNDSGTYRPQAEHQGRLKELLTMNFPGLDVLPLDFNGAQPEETKDFVGPNEIQDDRDAVYAGKWRWRCEGRAAPPTEGGAADSAEEEPYEWVPISRGLRLPPRAVRAGRTSRDGDVYVGRNRSLEAGKLNLDGDCMHNIWCHFGQCADRGDALALRPGASAEWIPFARGDAVPRGAVWAGAPRLDGPGGVYVGRARGGACGKINIDENYRLKNLWIHGHLLACGEGEILVVSSEPDAAEEIDAGA